MSKTQSISIANEALTLLPEKAIFWHKEKTLLISDNHFGKSTTFQKQGITIPQSNTKEDLNKITSLIEKTSAQRIIFLGDFFHAKCSKSEVVLTHLRQWRESNKTLKLILIRGNHDISAGDPPGDLNIECCDEPCIEAPFVLKHNPARSEEGYTIAGHVHPGVKLLGKGKQGMRLPCFQFTQSYCIMPAFGSFTGMFSISPNKDDLVYVIAGSEIMRVNIK